MSKVIPLEDKKWPRDHRNIHDDLDAQLSDIFAIASLLGGGQINATGYVLTRMITEAQKISEEHLRLWQGGAK